MMSAANVAKQREP